MARIERFKFSHTRKLDVAYRLVSEAADAGVVMNDGHGPNGRYVTVDGERLKNFGSCSYMALEAMPQLRECAHRAIDEYGTQFHFSRAYLQCSLYQELEGLLEQITGRPVLVAASTSLAHMSALPVLVKDTDHIIIDQFAHASLHTAVQLVPTFRSRSSGTIASTSWTTLLTRMRGHKGHVWYICDGLYSMLGDFAPFDELRALLDRHDQSAPLHRRCALDELVGPPRPRSRARALCRRRTRGGRALAQQGVLRRGRRARTARSRTRRAHSAQRRADVVLGADSAADAGCGGRLRPPAPSRRFPTVASRARCAAQPLSERARHNRPLALHHAALADLPGAVRLTADCVRGRRAHESARVLLLHMRVPGGPRKPAQAFASP